MNSKIRHAGSILWKTHPVHLTVFLTKRCNMQCPFCFYLKGAEWKDGCHEEITLEEIRKLSDNMGRLLWVAFSGGEIFLREDLTDICAAFYENTSPSIMLLPSNGMMPDVIRRKTEEVIRSSPKSVVVVKLSLDGLVGRHDAIRGTRGAFDRLMETYESLAPLVERYKNFELGINTLFCSANQDSMDEIIGFVKGMDKIKTHTITMVRGEIGNGSLKDIDPRKYSEAIDTLEDGLKQGTISSYGFRGSRLKSAQDILQRKLILRTLLEGKRLLPCYAAKLNIVVTEGGDVYPCELLSKSMGNLRDYGWNMARLLENDAAKNVRNFIAGGNCHCTHECNMMINILFNPMMYPSLLGKYLQL